MTTSIISESKLGDRQDALLIVHENLQTKFLFPKYYPSQKQHIRQTDGYSGHMVSAIMLI